MSKQIISQQDILEAGKQIIQAQGLQAITMRSVAKACHIAVGSLYNYYPSKGCLLIDIMTSIWTEMAHQGQIEDLSFIQTVQQLFENIYQGNQKYPLFFFLYYTDFSIEEQKVLHQQIHFYLQHIKEHLHNALMRDPQIDPSCFDDSFSMEALNDFVLSNLISLWTQPTSDCSFFLQVLQRLLYTSSKGEHHESQY